MCSPSSPPDIPFQQTTTNSMLHQNGSWLQALGSPTTQTDQQQLRLQSLQMECELLKLRQQEIKCQQEILMGGSGTKAGPTGLDPFLSGLADHVRQESADSGLSMVDNYSIPHTPDDYLSSIDDNMDCVSESDTGADTGILDAPDIGDLGDAADSTDDLVPTLQFGEEFTSDILNNVQDLINPSTKNDNVLTWI